MLFIGDSLRDGELASAGRVPFIAKLGTFTKEEFALRLPDAPTIAALNEVFGFLA
jgi:phosphoglycolate phosphatase-like HAD superfamily hydrolase